MCHNQRILIIRDEVDAIKEPVINKMQAFFGWTDEETEKQRAELEAVIAESDLKQLKEELGQ